jgi:hypothetical protein
MTASMARIVMNAAATFELAPVSKGMHPDITEPKTLSTTVRLYISD